MAHLAFLAEVSTMVSARCHRAGDIAVRMLRRALKKFRYLHVFFIIGLWYLCLLKVDENGPPYIRSLLVFLPENVTVWQTTLTLLLLFYLSRSSVSVMHNLGVESPDLPDKLYSPSFFQAVEVATALDAGFWTAMVFKKGWLRDITSLLFSFYYVLAPAQANEKVRRVRSVLTVEHMRIAWEKSTTSFLGSVANLLRPKFTKYGPREIQIQRPRDSPHREPVRGWLYFDGSLVELQKQTCLVLDIPGGGFVAMNPRTADDRLLAWAGKTKVPILSLDYEKAPEYPYPHALNECFDVYRTILETKGVCLGLTGDSLPRIVLSGDSAGGNLATSLVLKVLSSTTILPVPDGLVLAYPCLNMKVEAWMTPEQVSLIKEKGIGKSTVPSSNTGLPGATLPNGAANAEHDQEMPTPRQDGAKSRPELYVSSMISFIDDGILTPETMRTLILLYIGAGNKADFSSDQLLSPILAPSSLLSRFPKTYIVTGERDPMVDDTVIFASRLRQAKFEVFKKQQEAKSLGSLEKEFNDLKHVEVILIKGISHGFMQMAAFYPEAWNYILQAAGWVRELFALAELKDAIVPQRALSVCGIDPDSLIEEEELLDRRMKFLTGGLVTRA